jgi:hypothetical protein
MQSEAVVWLVVQVDQAQELISQEFLLASLGALLLPAIAVALQQAD